MRNVTHSCAAAIALAALLGIAGPSRLSAQARPSGLEGVWKSDGTSLRITLDKDSVDGKFVEVGTSAVALGFKPGETSLHATRQGNFLSGQQVIRYGNGQPCYARGRWVPMIGRLSLDGQELALHYYNLAVGPDCKDTGTYGITETLWQRVP